VRRRRCRGCAEVGVADDRGGQLLFGDDASSAASWRVDQLLEREVAEHPTRRPNQLAGGELHPGAAASVDHPLPLEPGRPSRKSRPSDLAGLLMTSSTGEGPWMYAQSDGLKATPPRSMPHRRNVPEGTFLGNHHVTVTPP
jgi:hypothetical protein